MTYKYIIYINSNAQNNETNVKNIYNSWNGYFEFMRRKHSSFQYSLLGTSFLSINKIISNPFSISQTFAVVFIINDIIVSLEKKNKQFNLIQ